MHQKVLFEESLWYLLICVFSAPATFSPSAAICAAAPCESGSSPGQQPNTWSSNQSAARYKWATYTPRRGAFIQLTEHTNTTEHPKAAECKMPRKKGCNSFVVFVAPYRLRKCYPKTPKDHSCDRSIKQIHTCSFKDCWEQEYTL